MITIEGTLKRDAEIGMDIAQRHVVMLLVDMGPLCDPVQVRRSFGFSAADALAASQWAREVRRGTTVRASGQRLLHITDHGERRFILLDVTDLTVG